MVSATAYQSDSDEREKVTKSQQEQCDGSADREPSNGWSGTDERKTSIRLDSTKSLNTPLESDPAEQATNNGCNEPVPGANEGEEGETVNSNREGREEPEGEGPVSVVTLRSLRETGPESTSIARKIRPLKTVEK